MCWSRMECVPSAVCRVCVSPHLPPPTNLPHDCPTLLLPTHAFDPAVPSRVGFAWVGEGRGCSGRVAHLSSTPPHSPKKKCLVLPGARHGQMAVQDTRAKLGSAFLRTLPAGHQATPESAGRGREPANSTCAGVAEGRATLRVLCSQEHGTATAWPPACTLSVPSVHEGDHHVRVAVEDTRAKLGSAFLRTLPAGHAATPEDAAGRAVLTDTASRPFGRRQGRSHVPHT